MTKKAHVPAHPEERTDITVLAQFVSRNVGLSLLASVLLFCGEIFVAYRFYLVLAGVSCGVLAIFLTYSVGGQRRFSSDWSFFQPLKGWTFFSFTILLPWSPWLLAWHFPQEAARVLVICAGASSVVGEIMMVCSLLTYNRPSDVPAKAKQEFKQFLQSRKGFRLWTAFIGLQAFLSIFACTLAGMADNLVTTHFSRLILIFFAVMCFSLSLFLTYGVGGRWKYYTTDWRFYQPFTGGVTFVVLQALAWAFFSISMLVFILHMYEMLCEILGIQAYFPLGTYLPTFFVAALSGVVAQVFNAASLFVYRGKFQMSPPPNGEDQVDQVDSSISRWSTITSLRQLCFVVALYNLEKMFGIFILLSLLLADVTPHTVVSTWVILGALYLPTYLNRPSCTGRRWLRGIRGHWFFNEVGSYFHLNVTVSSPLSPKNKYIFGFHPHGIFPITCGWVHFTNAWQRVLPGITPASLTSSVIHYVPLLRDICQLLSGLEVSREGFKQGLALHNSVIFVPGGQREMLESRSEDKDVIIYTAHKGFLRLAMELAATTEEDLYVVPVYSFGETQLLDNLRLPVALQRWCINKLRANVFFFPYGMLGLPGVPRPERLTMTVGEAVKVPRVDNPSHEQVELLHRRFYTELQKAFEKFKAEAGHPEDTMVLVPPVATLEGEEWDAAWKSCPRLTEPPRVRKPSHHTEEAWIGLTLAIMFTTVVWIAYF